MTKGRSKNKRARKPEVVNTPSKWPPAIRSAYFDLPDGKSGFADGVITTYYDPLTPVTHFRVTVMPAGHIRYLLAWDRVAGWTGEVPADLLPRVIPAVEKAFTPAVFRFEPIYI